MSLGSSHYLQRSARMEQLEEQLQQERTQMAAAERAHIQEWAASYWSRPATNNSPTGDGRVSIAGDVRDFMGVR